MSNLFLDTHINTIITGDCRSALPQLPDQCAALAFADPPYWVDFDYGSKTDSQMEYIDPHWLVAELRRVARVVCVTTGMRAKYDYPRPDWELGWFKFGSTRRNGIGGFNVWEPIVVYGKPSKRFYQDAINLPDVVNHTKDGDFHKCPKPLKLLTWIIKGMTQAGDLVIDPVAGSGTTCKAAKMLNRRWLGIEIDPHMTELANNRVALCQPLPLVESTEQKPLIWEDQINS